ncbi:leucine-rich repeat-containing protein 23 isoform X2 [Antennarius striatus]|uniref:leucine-rich repeat-containing protein 23 isoform X2 n=1 Tax=Antennarius striatus TaxID=241820 RepID=UPI0035AF7D79
MSDILQIEGCEEICTDEEQFSQLTRETVSRGLSLLCQIGNGLGHAFVKLDLVDKRLNDITAISSYTHLRFLDVSNNHLMDLSPLASLTHLLWLKVDHNAVEHTGKLFTLLAYLQWLNMAANRITDLNDLVGPALETLNLTRNRLQTLSLRGACFAHLVTLELRGNQLETTNGINIPSLQHLYLAQNVIKRLEGLDNLERVITLHLRDNQLETLDGLSPKMKCLKYLNVRGNAILDESALQGIRVMSKSLQTLVISENPVAESEDYRLNVLTLLPRLERLDKDPIFPEERSEARERINEHGQEEISGTE